MYLNSHEINSVLQLFLLKQLTSSQFVNIKQTLIYPDDRITSAWIFESPDFRFEYWKRKSDKLN